MADQLNPVGTVVSNIDTVTSVSLDIAFSTYSDPVLYPSFDQVRGGTWDDETLKRVCVSGV